ncbi:hypothetical protein ACNKHN_21865 [Shigella flexneri]
MGVVFRTAAYSASGQEQHYLGPLNGPELWWCTEAKAVGSVAMSMLGSDADWGLCCLPVAMPVTIDKGRDAVPS